MQGLINTLKALAILTGAFLLFVGLVFVSPRQTLLYWLIASSITLLVTFFKRHNFRWWAVGVMAVGIALAFSPLDFTIRSRPAGFGLRIMPVAYGYTSPENTVNYGCTLQRNPPKKALVLFL